MAFDGNGNFRRLQNWTADAANAVNINATEFDGEDNGFAAGLSNCVTRDGQGKMSVDFLPNADNTLNLGSGALRWATINGLPINSILNGIFYARTAAEITASIIPTNFTFPELYLERYGGSITASAAVNNAALTSAFAVATQKPGGIVYLLAGGTYTFSASFNIPNQTILQGSGYCTILNYTGSGSFLTILPAAGRVQIRDMQIIGTAQTGVGLSLGDATGNATITTLRNLSISKWATGMRIGGATWLTCEKCEFGGPVSGTLGTITNNVGIDFNVFAGGSTNYSSALLFKDCIVSNNANAGVQATSVPTTMNEVNWINCNVQNNCQSATGNPQFYMGPVLGFTIDNMYMEYLLGGTAPDALRADNLGSGQIRSFYCNTAANGIKDRGGGSVNQVEILSPNIFGITTGIAINLASETDVIIRNNSTAGTVTLTGSGCRYLPTGSGLASWKTDEATFTPVIAFGTSGSITQTVQAASYSQIGNVIFFNFRINWSAIAAPTGNVSITGFPIAPKSGGPDVMCSVMSAGLTIASGYLAIDIANGTTAGLLYNVQTTTAQILGSAFAASGFLIVSGSYQI